MLGSRLLGDGAGIRSGLNALIARGELRSNLAASLLHLRRGVRQLLDDVAGRTQLKAALQRAESNSKRLQEAMDTLPEGIVLLDADLRYITWNSRFEQMYPGTADLMKVGGRFEDAVRTGIARGNYPESLGREEEWLAERLQRLRNPGKRHEQKLDDGRCILIEERRISEGGTIGLRVDITEMKQREASFRLLFDANPLPMFVCDKETWSVVAANEAAVQHYGYARRRLMGMAFSNIHSAVVPGAMQELEASIDNPLACQSFRHVRRDGKLIEVELYCRSLVHEGKAAVLVAVIDITQKKLDEHRVAYMARHDALTGLPNRINLSEHMERVFRNVERGDTAALLFLDLDNFKLVNDTLGHAAGDTLLKEVARRLGSALRECDVVARLGGDEFAILLGGDVTPASAAKAAKRVLRDLREPIIIADKEFVVDASIGIAMAPEDASDAVELFRCSDLAMYTAKAEGRGVYRFFQKEMDEKVRARSALELALGRAIAEGELEVHYQPLYDFHSDRVNCMEALVRWRHPTRGLVPPGEFIPVAEETGMIVALGEYVLRRACQDAASWAPHIKVAVNVSALELESPGFLERISDALVSAGLPAHRLQVEVTETAVMSNIERSIGLLKQVRALGVEIAMDDFGTGYSSLSFLRSFPFDKIKIDRAFISDSSRSSDGRAILAAIVSLAKTLGMSTTAEGVETAEQREIAKAQGCTEIQGYLFSPPRPLAELQAIVQAGPDRDAA